MKLLFRWQTAAVVIALALLGGCSTPTTRVVLLPQADGRPSAVVVSGEQGEQTLSTPYQRATVGGSAGANPVVDQLDPARVRSENKALFEMMPPAMQRFTVYFDTGGATLIANSRQAMNDALALALGRAGGEIVLTGHTDTVGSVSRNDDLSRDRARQVRLLFLARNFPSGLIETAGRGERELAVPTPDQTEEPRNRRVTIDVR